MKPKEDLKAKVAAGARLLSDGQLRDYYQFYCWLDGPNTFLGGLAITSIVAIYKAEIDRRDQAHAPKEV